LRRHDETQNPPPPARESTTKGNDVPGATIIGRGFHAPQSICALVASFLASLSFRTAVWLANGTVKVRETGSVNELWVHRNYLEK